MPPINALDSPRRSRLSRLLAGAALFAVAFAAIGVVHVCRHRAGPETGSAGRGGTDPSVASPSEDAIADSLYGSESFWAKLASAYGSDEFVAFAVESAAPVTVDGRIDDVEWGDCFSVAAFDPTAGATSRPHLVRCRWNGDTLFVSVKRPGTECTTQPSDGRKACQLVLSTSDPAVRFRFAVSDSGTRAGHSLNSDQCKAIAPGSWQAAVRSSAETLEAEFTVSCRALGLASLRGGDSLDLTVRPEPDESAGIDVAAAPAYWMLDSLRGARTRIVLLSDEPKSGRTLRFANGLLLPGRCAMQWDLRQVNVTPGTAVTVPIAALMTGRAGLRDDSDRHLIARLIDPVGTDRPLALTAVHSERSSSRSLRQANLVIPPLTIPGLHEVQLFCADGPQVEKLVSWPLWATSDWHRPVRQYLLRCRDGIEESTPDPWPRSIGVAHAMRALAALDSTPGMDFAFTSVLSDLRAAMAAIGRGRPPRIPTGRSTLTFQSAPDRQMPITINVPASYDDRFAWPVYWGQPGLPNMVGIHGTASAAPLTATPVLEKNLHIDADRRYLFVWCAEAYVASDLMFSHPEPWAAAVLALRARWSPLAGNARNVPMLFYNHTHGGEDVFVQETAAKWMQEQGCQVEYRVLPGYQHAAVPEQFLPETSRWLLGHRRRASPQTVCCVADRYENASKYWVTIDAFNDRRSQASVTATVNGDSIVVRTNGNVAGYTLDLDRAPVSVDGRVLRIIEDGCDVGTLTAGQRPRVFRRLPDAGNETSLRKRPGLAGPISRALADRRFLTVLGASGDLRETELAQRLAHQISSAKWFSTESLPISDLGVGEERLRSSDVILLGHPGNHVWLRRFADTLPIRLEEDAVCVGRTRMTARAPGLLALYPNPLNADRLVLVLVSRDGRVLERMVQELVASRPAACDCDYAVFDASQDRDDLILLRADDFDWAWRPADDPPTLIRIERAHPAWQWTALVADVARRQAGADGFLAYTFVLRSPERLVGSITSGDLYARFLNDWLACVQVPRSILPDLMRKAFSASPDVVTSALPDHATAVSGPRRAANENAPSDVLFTIATSVDREGEIGSRASRGDPGSARQVDAVYSAASSCRLVAVHIVDSLVSFLRQNRGLDLDALLDAQPQPPARDRFQALGVLGKEVGL